MNNWVQLENDQNCSPTPRWGHTMVQLKKGMLLMFGGYADSIYFNDSWIYDSYSLKWKELDVGKKIKPQPRSNCSLVYLEKKNSVIIFGGGSSSNMRYDDSWQLQLSGDEFKSVKGKWKSITNSNTNGPWCRTYHITQKYSDFMIVQGGQAFGNDVDDLWAYDLNKFQWVEIKTKSKVPSCRFHSSAMLGSWLYILGGCQGAYNCLSSVYRINLEELKSVYDENEFHITADWEEVQYRKVSAELFRWGHSSCVYGNSIFIFGGRNSEDLNELLCLDLDQKLDEHVLRKVETNEKPMGRRKASLLSLGSFLFLYGGFNSKYIGNVSLLNLFYTKQLHRPSKNLSLSINPKLCDIRVTTIDREKINFNTALVDPAFESEQKKIQFMEQLADLPYKEACQYAHAVNNGQFFGENSQFLADFNIQCEDHFLATYKKRLRKHVIEEKNERQEKPYLPIRVSCEQFRRVLKLNQKNPHNNVIIQTSDEKLLKANSYLMSFRSPYFYHRFFNSHFKKSPNHRFEIPHSIFLFLLVYFQYGHLILPNMLRLSQILNLAQIANMYCLNILELICLEEIKYLMLKDKLEKKDFEMIFEWTTKKKDNQNYKILWQYSLAYLTGPRKSERMPFRSVINKGISHIKQKYIRQSKPANQFAPFLKKFQYKQEMEEIDSMHSMDRFVEVKKKKNS